jgi:hypothetical protein
MKGKIALLVLLAGVSASRAQFNLLSTYAATNLNAAEINAYDSGNSLVYSTFATGVEILDFGNTPGTYGQLSFDKNISFSSLFGGAISSVSSVAADPLNRGFGVATVIPTDNAGTVGKLAIFDPVAGTLLTSLNLGFNPDMVTFTPDGTKLLIANEGEPSAAGVNPAGSVSVVDLTGILNAAGAAGLTDASVTTRDFSSVDLSAALVTQPNFSSNRYLDIEPEYITVNGTRAYVTLQEANAVGVFDLTSNDWLGIQALGFIQQTIDATDREVGTSPGIAINDLLTTAPAPDGIASYTVAGNTYYITANEGDYRPAVNNGVYTNEARISTLVSRVDPAYSNALSIAYGGANPFSNTNLGRLNVLTDVGTNSAGLFTNFIASGSRSMSIWDAATGQRVADTGSLLEQLTAGLIPGFTNGVNTNLFNSDGITSPAGNALDTRSDNKGPEPESVVIGQYAGRTFAFLALERTGGIVQFDVTDPTNPILANYIHIGTNFRAPEGLTFVSNGPGGIPYLIASYEVSQQIAVFAVPEPGSALALLATLGVLPRRRRRA